MAPVQRAEWLESRDRGPSRMPVRRASMIGHYLDLALRSCRRSKALTALVIVLMGCGVATCMAICAVFRFWQRAGQPDPDPAIRTATHAAGTAVALAAGSDRRAAGRAAVFGVSARPVAPQSMPSFFSL